MAGCSNREREKPVLVCFEVTFTLQVLRPIWEFYDGLLSASTLTGPHLIPAFARFRPETTHMRNRGFSLRDAAMDANETGVNYTSLWGRFIKRNTKSNMSVRADSITRVPRFRNICWVLAVADVDRRSRETILHGGPTGRSKVAYPAQLRCYDTRGSSIKSAYAAAH